LLPRSSPFDGLAALFQRPGFTCFRLKAACSACALLTLRVSRFSQMFRPVWAFHTYRCHLPGLFHPGAILGICPFRVCSRCKPDTFRFAVPFFPFVVASGHQSVTAFFAVRIGCCPVLTLETSSFRASTASLAAPGSASSASASLQILPLSLLRAIKRVRGRCHSSVACTVRKTPVSLPERASLELASSRVA